MGTITEEIFSKKLGREVSQDELCLVDVDAIMSHDTTTPLAIESLEKINKNISDKNKIIICFDHIVPPANVAAAALQKRVREFIKENGIKNFFQEGICHQVMVEKGFVTPGKIIIGADSHTCTYGALGAFATGMGSTDIAVAYATGKTWFLVPATYNINVSGKLAKGVYAKDLMLHIAKTIGAGGATYKAVEFNGMAIKNFSISERMTLCNMAIEIGAKAGLVKADEKTIGFLKNITDKKIEPIGAKNPSYEKEFDFSASDIEPQIAKPSRVDNVTNISNVQGTKIDEVFIGTCTNGRLDDLKIVASILKGKRIDKDTRVIITPASNKVYQEAAQLGLIKIFMDSGCIVTNPGCGACIGRHGGVLAPGEKALTTMNRNFVGRMGSPESEIFLGSPATCAASTLKGEITDPRGFIR